MQFYRLSDCLRTLRPRQNERHFTDDIFKCIFLNESVWILIKISLKFVPQGSINNIPELIQIMAWHQPGDKPLSVPMMVRLPTHMCVTRPQWLNSWRIYASVNQTITDSDNGLSRKWCQAIIWILSIEPLGINFSEISMETQTFALKKRHLKMSFAKWWPSCVKSVTIWWEWLMQYTNSLFCDFYKHHQGNGRCHLLSIYIYV